MSIAPAIDVRPPDSFEIEKGIPFPRGHYRVKYPFRQMLIGDSFYVPTELANKIRSAAEKFSRTNKRKYTVRKLANKTYRCWRIK